jgi:signal transduction histidine kinase
VVLDRLPSWLVPVLLGAAQLAVWPGGALLFRAPVRPAEVAWGVTATVLACAALAFRRRYPVLALAGVAGASALGEPIGSEYALGLLNLGELLALYSVAVRRRLPVSIGATAGLVGWHLLIGFVLTGTPDDVRLIEYLLVLGSGYGRRRWIEGRHAAAAQLARAEAEQERAAVAERERLARELHDVSAHHLTSIVVTVDAARKLAGKRAELAAEALDFSARTGRETLSALHRLVAVMRTVEGDDDQPLQAQLNELAGGFNQLGLEVTVSVADGVPAALSAALHGIAREALTNALRYAPGSQVRVGVGHRGGSVELTVDDDGAGDATAGAALGSGRGLAGARERAAAVGGTFAAGPRPEGGWRVLAVLPAATASTWSRSVLERPVDVATVVAIAGFPLLATLAADPGSAPVVAAVAVAHAAPLLWRRQAPWLVLAGVLTTGWLAPLALLTGLAGQVTVIFAVGGVAEFVAVHAVAAYGRRRWTVWPAVPVAAAGLGAVLVAIAAADGVLPGGPVTTARILGAWWVGAAILLAPLSVVWGEAYAQRRRRERVLASERAALAAAADKAVAVAHAERLAIAAELRSVVLHRAAQVVTVAEEGRLADVADEARGTLGAMRELLGSLRGDQPVDGRAPQPTAEAIDALCREHREAGREVTLDRPENAPAIPADVDLSAFRVVEAALSTGDTGPAVVRWSTSRADSRSW